QRLGLTQREFARKFQIALGTLRDWEQGSRRPDSAAKAYLRVISEVPEIVVHALQTGVTPPVVQVRTQPNPSFIIAGAFASSAEAVSKTQTSDLALEEDEGPAAAKYFEIVRRAA